MMTANNRGTDPTRFYPAKRIIFANEKLTGIHHFRAKLLIQQKVTLIDSYMQAPAPNSPNKKADSI